MVGVSLYNLGGAISVRARRRETTNGAHNVAQHGVVSRSVGRLHSVDLPQHVQRCARNSARSVLLESLLKTTLRRNHRPTPRPRVGDGIFKPADLD